MLELILLFVVTFLLARIYTVLSATLEHNKAILKELKEIDLEKYSIATLKRLNALKDAVNNLSVDTRLKDIKPALQMLDGFYKDVFGKSKDVEPEVLDSDNNE